jgi:glutathione S-transferase
MKLYYMTGACSLAPRIVAKELGLNLQYEKVNQNKTTETGADFMKISPTGTVPAIELENGELLTEAAVIMQYLCDLVPGQNLLLEAGSMGRVRVQEWLNYVSSEVHKSVGFLFAVGRIFPEEIRPQVTESLINALPRKFERLEKVLKNNLYLYENKFSPADAYLFVVLTWTKAFKIDLSKYPGILAFMENMYQRPSVRAAMQDEGLKVK